MRERANGPGCPRGGRGSRMRSGLLLLLVLRGT